MTRAQRSKWNRDNWVPEQYVADASLAREARRLAKRKETAEAAQRRGGGIFGLAQALASRNNPHRRRGRKSARRGRRSRY